MLLVVALAAGVALWWWWTHPPDASAELRARRRPLERLERWAAPELGTRFERWRMIGARGDIATALWRPSALRPAPDGAWTVVILGGIGTDDRAALLVADSLPVNVLAVSWPWKGSRTLGRLEFLASVPALREALLRTPACLAAGVDAARRAEPGVRVALLGASLGAPPAAAAVEMARPDALVLVDGAADLERLLRSEVRRTVDGVAGAALAGPAASLAARLLSSLEPSRHGRAEGGLPVLLIDAQADHRYPGACVDKLHATYPHADRAVHPGEHMRPEHREQIEAIVGMAWAWLRALPRPGEAAGR